MAEATKHTKGRDTMPRQGNVENVCKQWLVHEDGALAYQIQNTEIERHYGLNRFNRRTVREDMPVAKVLQTEEDVRQQEERYNELQALSVQADEDQEVARRVMEEIEGEETARQRQRELQDEEIARLAQEKEQKKYEKYMEKKREKDLKKERQILERQLEQHMVEARLTAGSDGRNIDGLDDAMQGMQVSSTQGDRGSFSGRQVNGGTRVTPAGIIEDDGDFSDFFTIPDHISNDERKVLQELQDEELARLLQEQEHKRTKAEVDRTKLKEIEEQDERLAKIIQEQDKLRLKRAKQRKKQQQQEEQQRRQQQMMNNNPASRPLPDLPGQRSSTTDAPVPPVQRGPDRSRLRRDSFLQGIDSSQIPPPSSVGGDTLQSRQSGRSQHPSEDIPHNSLQSVERWLAGTASEAPYPHDDVAPHGYVRTRQQTNQSDSYNAHHMPPSPSPPGSYHSEDEMPPYRPLHPPKHVSVINTAAPPPPVQRGRSHGEEEPCYAVSNAIPYNIAAAIDPTYKRRQHQIQDETDVKMPVQMASSLPISADVDLEWDPNVRGSLRRPKGTWNPVANNYFTESALPRDDSFTDEGPVLNPWQPVQGQRRSTTDRTKRPKKPVASPTTNSGKGQKHNSSCKQQ